PRQVGQALKALPPDMGCPWHRVVNARGAVSIRAGSSEAHMSQEELLEAEGVEFRNGRLDLEVYRWHSEV
ncbi:MAG: MGMT family protein, partial [bacterium]|nr:MGMT family protein [bacterium]